MKNHLQIVMIFLSVVANGQRKLVFADALKTADSIQITSHLPVDGFRTVNGETVGYHTKLMRNGRPNDTIVKEIITLDKTSKAQLIAILLKKGKSAGVDVKCFEPHHSIFIFKNGKCYFLDICFHCENYEASAAFDLGNGILFSGKDWENLESFFRERGIQYEMPIIRK